MPIAPRSLKQLFLDALAVSRAERAAWLSHQCAEDTALRQQLELMLAAHEAPQSLLDRVAPPTAPGPVTEDYGPESIPTGTKIGPYKLLQQIGEGGMGVVYMAQQTVPVERRVALKIIKPGMDTRQVIARFEAERQALAIMDHPNIAKVFDAGTTDSGRPYFVMELVRGIPITKYCDEHQLTLKQRLELFLPVCQAVQHAHQKGIIHRDLKPSNSLVAQYDDKPVPKVIDFGVAKAAQKLTERTMFTEFGQVVGTLEYMSPEQARLNQLDIDTRSDIYSLGVLLYELLTGCTPFDGKRLRSAAFDEMLRIIREEEPLKPSTRLSSAATLPSIAASRSVEPARLGRALRGELDWIVMKALEKDRNRRYETSSGLARDIERYLHDEPVQACPPSSWYRLRKFVRRNKLALATGAMIAGAVVAAVIILAVSNGRILREKQDKEFALDQAKQGFAEAKKQEKLATQSAERAKASELLARQQTYVAQINLADQAWSVGDMQRVRDLLDSLRPPPRQEDLRGFEWYHLARLCESHRLLLKGHQGHVRSVVFSPDGHSLATAGDDNLVRLWDAASGKAIATLSGHKAPVCCLAFAPDGLSLASGGADRTVILWDVAARTPRATFDGFPETVSCLAFSRDGRSLVTATAGLATGRGTPLTRVIPRSRAGELKVLDVTGDGAPLVLGIAPTGILAMAISPNGTTLAAASSDSVQLYDISRGAEGAPIALTGDSARVMSLDFTGDGKTLVAGNWKGDVMTWDISTRNVIEQWNAHRGPIVSLVLSADDNLLITGSVDQTVKVWNTKTKKVRRTIRGHADAIWSVDLSADGQNLATASWDGAVKLWVPDRSQEFDTVDVTGYSVGFSPNSELLAVSSTDVKFFDVSGLQLRGQLAGYNDSDISLAFSPDGKTLATGGIDSNLRLWDIGAWTCRALLSGHSAKIWSVAFSPKGQTLASGSGTFNQDGEIRVWDVSANEARSVWAPDTWTVRAVAFSPDGRTLAASCHFKDRTRDAVQIWDLRTGQPCGSLKGEKSVVDWVAFSPDGALIATGRSDRLVRIWITDTGELHSVLKGHSDVIYHGAFSPDGKTLATASWDGTVKLWHVATGQALMTFSGPGGVIWSVAFAPDGQTFAMGAHGKTMLRRAATRQPSPAHRAELPD